MNKYLPLSFLSAALLINTFTEAQDRFAYAITDLTKEGGGWTALRKLDLETGTYSDVMLNGLKTDATIYDAFTKKPLTLQSDARFGNSFHAPFSTGVAAAAYDRKNNRLYYTPMFIDQLRYIDLKTMQVYYVNDVLFSRAGNMQSDEGKIITRMVIAPDGYGYAISNDAGTFIRFSTGKKLSVEHLGGLVDDPSNNGISVKNKCTSYGGDMIADDKGNLFIFSARNQVFTVNTETKVAKHLGAISNLPSNFTVNGAVVDAKGSLLVSSAMDSKSYVVNPKDWTATPFNAGNATFKSSDLANGNYLSSRIPTRPELAKVDLIKPLGATPSGAVSIYPNPVTENTIVLQFNKLDAGEYTIELADGVGRSVVQQRVRINGKSDARTLNLDKGRARGSYLVRVVDRNNVTVFAQTVLVQ